MWFKGANTAFRTRRGLDLDLIFLVVWPVARRLGGNPPLVRRVSRERGEALEGRVSGGRALKSVPSGNEAGPVGSGGFGRAACGFISGVWEARLGSGSSWKPGGGAGGGEVPGARCGLLARTVQRPLGDTAPSVQAGQRAAAVTSPGGLPVTAEPGSARGAASGPAARTPPPGPGQQPAHLPGRGQGQPPRSRRVCPLCPFPRPRGRGQGSGLFTAQRALAAWQTLRTGAASAAPVLRRAAASLTPCEPRLPTARPWDPRVRGPAQAGSGRTGAPRGTQGRLCCCGVRGPGARTRTGCTCFSRSGWGEARAEGWPRPGSGWRG